MKVLVFSGYGSNYYTKGMLRVVKNIRFPLDRVGEIIDYVENNAQIVEDSKNIEDILRKDTDKIVNVKGSNFYYMWNNKDRDIEHFTIIDVDTTKQWTIKDYDGAESIKYIEPPKLICEEMNYYEI